MSFEMPLILTPFRNGSDVFQESGYNPEPQSGFVLIGGKVSEEISPIFSGNETH